MTPLPTPFGQQFGHFLKIVCAIKLLIIYKILLQCVNERFPFMHILVLTDKNNQIALQ